MPTTATRFLFALGCIAALTAPVPAETPPDPDPPRAAWLGTPRGLAEKAAAPPAATIGSPLTKPEESAGAEPVADCTASAGCCPCDPPGRMWLSGEYLIWALRGSPLPPLVTAAPATTMALVPGALGNPDTVLLYGNNQVNNGLRSGFRFQGGLWLDRCHTWGLDASFFYLNPVDSRFRAGSDGSTVSLFRPIFNTMTGAPGVEDVTNLADGIVGQVGVQTRTAFLGGDLNLRRRLCCNDCCGRGYRLDLLAGYRALSLTESLQIQENLITLDLANVPNGTIFVQDRFRTGNLFQGGQLGLDGQWWRGPVFVGARGLLGLGNTRQTVDIDGVTIAQGLGGVPLAYSGGLLALPTNIGHYQRDVFTFAPAFGLKLGIAWTSWLRTWVGYDVMYWSSVVRPGNQVDLAVNPNGVPPPLGLPLTPPRPAFGFNSSDFWIQGVACGLDLRF